MGDGQIGFRLRGGEIELMHDFACLLDLQLDLVLVLHSIAACHGFPPSILVA